MARRLAVCAVLFACVPAAQVHAAVVQQVQSGTLTISGASGNNPVAISSVDMTKSVLIFQTSSNSAEPGTSEVRGRLASSTSIEFVRDTDNSPAAGVTVQWYLATFASGVFVQRGETTQSGTTTNVAITSVTSMSQAFVLYSKTPVATDSTWGGDDAVAGELTSATQLTFRANTLNAGHNIAWQVVQFTNGAADINVQKGSTAMVSGALTATATLSPAVNVNTTFVLAGIRTTDGTVTDIGARMVKAVLTNSTTITFERSIAGTSDITEIVWQAVELKDGSTVRRGNAVFSSGATATAQLQPTVNLTRAVAFISTQNAGGQSMGKSPSAGNILGVATATAVLTATDQITLTRSNTVYSAELGWFVVQFNGGNTFKVGSFTKGTGAGPVSQVIPHGLGQVPKAMILWTEGRTDETFSNATNGNITFRAATSALVTGAPETDVIASTDGAAASTSISTPAFSTVSGNELLLVFVEMGGAGGTPETVTAMAGAGLTWVLVKRTNAQQGTAEIWRAFATTTLTGVTVTATLSSSRTAAITVISYKAVDTSGVNGAGAIGATGTANGTGAPSASLTTTRNNSLVVGVGNDTTKATARTVPANQSMVHEFLPSSSADSYWVQQITLPVVASGTVATINDTAPTADKFNLSIAEILPALTSTLTINVPAGTVVNDVMVASIGVSQATGGTITTPAGWTLSTAGRVSIGTGTPNALAVYYKVAGASEPSSYSWTISTTTGAVGGIQSFSGVDVTNPVDIDGSSTHAASTLSASPTVTTTVANAMIVRSHTFSSSATRTITTGTGTTAFDQASITPENANGQSIEANYVVQAVAALSAAQTTTASSNLDTGVAHTLALRPGSGTSVYVGFGMTDGATSRSLSAASRNGVPLSNAASQLASKVLTITQFGVVLAEANFTSWDETNVTLNWTTNDAFAYVVHYIAVGGTDLSAKVVPWTMGPASGDRVVTGVPFRPSVVLHAYGSYLQSTASPITTAGAAFGLGAMDGDGNQWANQFFTVDAATADTQRGQQINATIYAFDAALAAQRRATFVTMNADGFTVNFTAGSAVDAQVISLALAGLNAQVGNFDKVASPTTAQVVTGVNFQPAAVLLTSFQDVPRTGGPVAHSRFGIGASDGTTQGSSAFQDQNAAAPTNMIGVDKTSKVFVKTDNTTTAAGTIIDAEADFTSMNVDGFTLNWTTNDAVQTQILYLALAQMNNTEVRLISFDAAKYAGGVLVQWRTGYEIDNLGFNVYREINHDGNLVKVNASLIAGSGLHAGQGGVVTNALSYARWDLDAAAGDPTVSYWLEDVEFNGKSKWHGPVTPVAGTLQDPAAVGDSDELGDLSNATDSRRIFFNYNEDPVHPGPRVVPAQVAPEVTRQWALAGQATVKIGIRKAGWYRVTQVELIDAGLGSAVDPGQLQLFVNGTEQAIRVNGATASSFESIEFYASGIDTPYTDTRIYWLQSGAQAGRRIAVDPGGASAPLPITGFPSRLLRKDRIWYAAAIANGDAENWFGPLVCPQSPTPQQECDDPWTPAALTLMSTHIDRSAGGTAQLNVAVQGVTSATDGGANHSIRVLVNGIPVGEMAFAGQARAEQIFPFSVDVLVDGENTVSLTARGGDRDINLVDAIALSYPHTYEADADRLKFTVSAPGSIAVGGFASPSIRVFDITDRTAPVQLPVTVVTDMDVSTATVHVPGTGPRTLMAFSDETVATPEFVRRNQASNLHASSNASNYVVISHADFLAQVAVLAAHRQQQGHQAVVVDVEDVYDEFSFGEKTPQAIRDFLRWARTNWATSPKFVVLAGDATVDPRDYDGLGNGDFVPTKQVAMASLVLETASDDWFVDFADNGLPDIAIGRLSVRTAQAAAAMVAKIVGYDAQAAQPWMKDVLLVADRDLTENFDHTAERLSALLPPAYAAHKVFRSRLDGAAAHQELQDRVNAGQLIVNYTGHGSTGIWGRGGELLSKADVTDSWTNATRLPFVVAMNCLNGFFNATYGDGNDEASLAEAMVRAPNGGAVAVWASSSLTPAATQALVNEELFRLIFAGTYATLGEAVTAAKRVVANQDLRRSWIFFGDPAMRLSGALQPVSTIAPVITTQPQGALVASGQRAGLTVAATGSEPLSYQWYVGVSGQTTNRIAGGTSSNYTTQTVANGTSYWVRVSNPYGTADSSVAVISTPLAITTENPWPSATAGIAYALRLAATDSTPPYQWAASGLPSGLQLDAASGEIFDAPNGAGTFTFTIQVTGADGVSAQQAFTLTVNAASDVLFEQQWHLQDRQLEAASANVVPVWSTTRGAGVVIGIVDDGVQATHPDLQANYVAALSYDVRDHDADASPVTAGACDSAADCQGTAVAGIAAARGDNGYGGSGVAPLASLAGIRLAAHGGDADEAAAFAHASTAVAIENHSWHRGDDGQTLAAPGPLAEAALASAIAQGRAGAGRIFVWAAGDGRARGDNCNFDGYATSRFGIAVGAVDDTGQAAPYSEACSALLVSAPSSGTAGHRSLTTTDLLGADGFAPGGDTDTFGGTAAAAPVVSGVVALMLARNPALTWRDVQHILVRTSRPVAATDASWTLGPFPHSEQYGFGVVDALLAVTRAATWMHVSPEQAVTPVTHAVGALIPDDTGAGVSDAITISAGTRVSIEHVEVEFTAAHPHRGDLEVTLTSPAGVVSRLGPARPDDGGADFAGWRFRSVRHWGEAAAGTWTITVTDRAAGHVGVFTGWTLRLFGTALPPVAPPTVAHATAHDFDGDGTADLMVYRPAAGTWFRRLASTHFTDEAATAFGLPGDVPVAGDYDGDGKIDQAVYRPAVGRWFIQPSGGGVALSYAWGLRTDVPTPGDYDGDGKTDLAVYRPSSGTWMILRSSDGAAVTISLGLRTDLPVPADYDGDGTTDLAIFRPATGIWYVLRSSEGATPPRTTQWGLRGDVPVPGDYDGDGQADLAVYRPSSGMWFLRPSATLTAVTVQWGLRTDVPVPADYDGNGTIDVAVFRPATGMWYLLPSTTDAATSMAVQWGLAGDIPTPNATVAYGMTLLRQSAATRTRTADLDGDGQADLTVFRPSSGTWYTRLSATGTTAVFQWGLAGDIPVAEDYDGDGTTDLAVYRPATGVWYLRLSTTNFAASASFQWGVSGDVPVPGDYDGDGIADLAIFRPATGTWYIRQSSTSFATSVSVQWGLSGDVPVPGDYDGDGVADLAIFRPSTGVWHLRPSSTPDTPAARQWGLGGDIPLPGDYDGDGRIDLAVYRPSTGVWWLLPSGTNVTTVVTIQWGLSDDLPVPGDYDGDGTTDLAVWRPADGVWYLLPSSAGFTASSSVQWGLAGDVPISTRQ